MDIEFKKEFTESEVTPLVLEETQTNRDVLSILKELLDKMKDPDTDHGALWVQIHYKMGLLIESLRYKTKFKEELSDILEDFLKVVQQMDGFSFDEGMTKEYENVVESLMGIMKRLNQQIILYSKVKEIKEKRSLLEEAINILDSSDPIDYGYAFDYIEDFFNKLSSLLSEQTPYSFLLQKICNKHKKTRRLWNILRFKYHQTPDKSKKAQGVDLQSAIDAVKELIQDIKTLFKTREYILKDINEKLMGIIE